MSNPVQMWFSVTLLKWYKANKRRLPWRKTKAPYPIWISEIILQQTRVDQGLPYYEKFIKSFPTILSLAEAEEEEVLKAWQGLGYYSRARNLHHSAKIIINNYGGLFPSTYDEIIKLKGIGVYTAAAIASICFREAKAVVDGNVYRVLSRFYGLSDPIDSTVGKKKFAELAQKNMYRSDPGDYNQAVMEFGALYCKPTNPDCRDCVLNNKCAAKKNDLVELLPVKSKKVKQTNRFFNYIVITGNKGSFYQMRTAKDIWQNMYEPLLIESTKLLGKQEILKSDTWANIFGKEVKLNLERSEKIEHKLTHQNIKAVFWKMHLDSSVVSPECRLQEFDHEELAKIPVPRLIEKYMALQK